MIQNNVIGTLNLFEAIRLTKIDPKIQLYSTSEVYGQVDPENVPISETCPQKPSVHMLFQKLHKTTLGIRIKVVWSKDYYNTDVCLF